jgi:hypothetical protein
MFHYFKIPYFTSNFFTKFTYNEYIGPYFLSHVVLRFSPSDLPEMGPQVLTVEAKQHRHTTRARPSSRSQSNRLGGCLVVPRGGLTWAFWDVGASFKRPNTLHSRRFQRVMANLRRWGVSFAQSLMVGIRFLMLKMITYTLPTPTGVGHQWTIPTSRGHF